MTAPDEHFDLDAAAEVDEGVDVDGTRLAHAAACAECGHRLAQVRATRALLSSLPDEQMPTEVADRLHEALPREPVGTTIVPVVGRRRRWTSSPALAGLAAAAAAIALVAAISIGSLRSDGHDSNSSGAAAGADSALFPQRTTFPVLASGAHYDDDNAGDLVATLDGLVRTPSSPPPTSTPARSSAQSEKDAVTLSAHAPVPAELQNLFGNRTKILECARRLAGGPITPLAVDFARFTGGLRHVRNAPAMIVLLPASGGLRDSAFIVGPQCNTDPSQDIYAFVQPVS